MKDQIFLFIDQFRHKDYQVLGLEIVLFSGVFGAAYQLWIVFAAILSVLMCILTLPRGKMYASAALSCLWGIIAASIGQSYGGWPWAIACGLIMLLIGMATHWRSLNLSVEREVLFRCSAVNRIINHRWERESLN